MKPSADAAAATPRRRALAALLAAAGVGGLSWLGLRALAPSSGEGAASEAEQALWQQRFQSPGGAEWAMQSFHGQRLVVNFWATWCPPCIAELPLLEGFYQQNAASGWQVVGLAVDKPAAVRSFLARTPLHFPIGLAQEGGSALARSLGNLSGGLPFTVVLGRDGRVLHRKIGQLKAPDLQHWRDLSGV